MVSPSVARGKASVISVVIGFATCRPLSARFELVEAAMTAKFGVGGRCFVLGCSGQGCWSAAWLVRIWGVV